MVGAGGALDALEPASDDLVGVLPVSGSFQERRIQVLAARTLLALVVRAALDQDPTAQNQAHRVDERRRAVQGKESKGMARDGLRVSTSYRSTGDVGQPRTRPATHEPPWTPQTLPRDKYRVAVDSGGTCLPRWMYRRL